MNECFGMEWNGMKLKLKANFRANARKIKCKMYKNWKNINFQTDVFIGCR